jgi:hypothetical protein
MFSWFNNKKVKETKPTVIQYGKYKYKPIINRALKMVTGMGDSEVQDLLSKHYIYLNDKIIAHSQLNDRMHSGQYKIERKDTNTIWSFFI